MSKLVLHIRVSHRSVVESPEIAGDVRLRDRYSHPDCKIICYKDHGVRMTDAKKHELDYVVMIALQNAGMSVAALRYSDNRAGAKTRLRKQEIESRKKTFSMFDSEEGGD